MQPSAPPARAELGVPRRVLAAAVIGTVLEWYDFAIYAALATVIGCRT